MELSGLELTALCKMGMCIAQADNKLAEEEKEVLFVGLAEFGLDQKTMEAVISAADEMQPFEAIRVMAFMDENQKKFACGFLAQMMVADDDVDDSELKLWQYVSTVASFPTMTILEAVEFWRNN